MRTLGFPLEHSYVGENAWINVRLTSIKTPTIVRALIDTGAAFSVLNRSLIGVLGINVRRGRSVDLVLADKSLLRAYLHAVQCEILGEPLTIDVAFAPAADTANVLGMSGLFDQMHVAFLHSERKVLLRRARS
jgi:predicted aspartyl protease